MKKDIEGVHPLNRFNNRAENYLRYRPDYPPELFTFIKQELQLPDGARVADIGSGTGLFSRHLLKNGYKVISVEPNAEMRQHAVGQLGSIPGFTSVDGRGEATGLPSASVDAVFVAQAFHWMDAEKVKTEFYRILKPGGKTMICWILATQSSDFLIAYEQLRQKHAIKYKPALRNNEVELAKFYSPALFNKKIFNFQQQFSYDALRGLLLSVSFLPQPGHPSYDLLAQDTQALFERFNKDGKVEMDYELVVYWNS